MNLQPLCSAPHVSVYFDSWNNWLYVEWEGDLTLPAVQYACLEVAQCFIEHAYPRVLNSDAQVTSLPWDITPWLAKHYFPGLALAGIKQLAWVHAPTVRGRNLAEQVLQQLPHLNVSLFRDIEDAASWLQQTRPDYVSGCALLPRPARQDTQLAQTVARFKQALEAAGVHPPALALV
ncbi:MAG: hypothetical protein ACRYFK_10315 [Janthinobacterium lividum]